MAADPPGLATRDLPADQAATGVDVADETLIRAYRSIVLIREAEERVRRLFAEAKLPGFIHSYLGEEAVAAGVCAVLRPDDWITSHHRGHGHILAKGGDLVRFFAELYGRVTGYCRGKGGSMHVADLELGILGANGVVGAGLPIAAGAALAANLGRTDRVAVAFIGDGATDIGAFHETLNLAAVWQLPVVCVVENNGYADFIARLDHQKIELISERAAGYGMPGETVDGNDVEAVIRATAVAVERARRGGGPSLLECVTYRWRGHYEGDPQAYRTEDEVESWKVRDPLPRAEALLRARGLLDDAAAEELRADVREQIDRAVEAAEAAPFPDPLDALTDIYVDPALVAADWET